MRLQTERLVIDPLAGGDVEAFVRYRRNPDVARWQGWTVDYSEADARTLTESQAGLAMPLPGNWLQLGMHARDDGRLVGDVAVHALDGDRGNSQPDSFELGVTLASAEQGKGFASEGLRAVIDHLFARHSAHRLVAFCDARNAPVAALLLRVGMRQESHAIDADWFKGEWTTLDGYALLSTEWAARR